MRSLPHGWREGPNCHRSTRYHRTRRLCRCYGSMSQTSIGLQVQVQDRHRPTLDKLTNKCVTVGDDTKGAARRSPKYIRKTKNTLWNAVMCLVERWNKWCLITEILRRATFTHKISLKSALSYGDSLNNF